MRSRVSRHVRRLVGRNRPHVPPVQDRLRRARARGGERHRRRCSCRRGWCSASRRTSRSSSSGAAPQPLVSRIHDAAHGGRPSGQEQQQ
jgi:hypothetical protein